MKALPTGGSTGTAMRATILLGTAIVTALSLAGSSLALVDAIGIVGESQEFAIDSTMDFATAVAEDVEPTTSQVAEDALAKTEAVQSLGTAVTANVAGQANAAVALGSHIAHQVYGHGVTILRMEYEAAAKGLEV